MTDHLENLLDLPADVVLRKELRHLAGIHVEQWRVENIDVVASQTHMIRDLDAIVERRGDSPESGVELLSLQHQLFAQWQ